MSERLKGLSGFVAEARRLLPASRVREDYFSRLTQGVDASCYQLVPALVLMVETEAEVRALCVAATRHGVPLTFRAAGTSLSGQAVTDAVLVKLSRDGWRHFALSDDLSQVTLGPGLVGGQVNARLARHGRKIGPDPASIGAAMIGGIVANNSSGMCCGTSQNSYRTLRRLRLVMADGTVLDTGCADSRAAFARSHAPLLHGLADMAASLRRDPALTALIRRKYAIKNTTGYGLNALDDFDDPIDILAHLVVGSEGTLAFIAEVTLDTIPDPRCKAAALVLFGDMAGACEAAIALKAGPVSAVEVMDEASLRSVIGRPGMPEGLEHLAPGTAALLIDIRAETPADLTGAAVQVTAMLAPFAPLAPVSFAEDARTYGNLWNVRKGLLPSVGSLRAPGTTLIVEDVAVPLPSLARAAEALRRLFDAEGYADAILFGHALDGNLHFVFPQSFNTPEDIARYRRLTEAFTRLIAVDFHGSLKAEHGTGRNMAPFVELEWGAAAYALMRQIKALFDPAGILNPGVLLSDDPEIFLRDLKPILPADPLIDACIECGFCEPVCPSRALTLTPRQRIVATRARSATPERIDAEAYAHAAVDTCAGDGLCATACPVGIDTGAMMRRQREGHGPGAEALAEGARRHLGALVAGTRVTLGLAGLAGAVVGPGAMAGASSLLRRASGGRSPHWTAALPGPGRPVPRPSDEAAGDRPSVLLFTACTNAAMGPARDAPDRRPLWSVIEALLHRAGHEVRHLDAAASACCGMPFASKGFPRQAENSRAALQAALVQASEGGRALIVADSSPCTLQLTRGSDLELLDIAPALAELVLPALTILRRKTEIALHIPCSTRRAGQDSALLAVARACAETVILPEGIDCCGFAGDKGFTTPELNASALRHLREQLPDSCRQGFSTSRTCEIGLSEHSGRPYQSIAYLLDWATAPEVPGER